MIDDADMGALRRDRDLAPYLRSMQEAARAECVRRRALVLAYPDLAQRLTEPPHGWTAPERWNGYIPPATWNQSPNTAPQRRALLELVAEAERRSTGRRAA